MSWYKYVIKCHGIIVQNLILKIKVGTKTLHSPFLVYTESHMERCDAMQDISIAKKYKTKLKLKIGKEKRKVYI